MCWTEEESSMSMSSSVLKVSHLCSFCGVKEIFGVGGKGLKRAWGIKAVKSQHGTGVGGSSHPCTKNCITLNRAAI